MGFLRHGLKNVIIMFFLCRALCVEGEGRAEGGGWRVGAGGWRPGGWGTRMSRPLLLPISLFISLKGLLVELSEVRRMTPEKPKCSIWVGHGLDPGPQFHEKTRKQSGPGRAGPRRVVSWTAEVQAEGAHHGGQPYCFARFVEQGHNWPKS